MVFKKQKTAGSGFYGHSESSNMQPYKTRKKDKTVYRKRTEKQDEYFKKNYSIWKRMPQKESPYDNLFVFSDKMINEMLKKRCLIISEPDGVQEYFMDTFPVRKPFLITDGKTIRARVEFNSRRFIENDAYCRWIYIREFRKGYYLKDVEFDNGFSSRFYPEDIDTFISYFR